MMAHPLSAFTVSLGIFLITVAFILTLALCIFCRFRHTNTLIGKRLSQVFTVSNSTSMYECYDNSEDRVTLQSYVRRESSDNLTTHVNAAFSPSMSSSRHEKSHGSSSAGTTSHLSSSSNEKPCKPDQSSTSAVRFRSEKAVTSDDSGNNGSSLIADDSSPPRPISPLVDLRRDVAQAIARDQVFDSTSGVQCVFGEQQPAEPEPAAPNTFTVLNKQRSAV